MTSKEDLVHQRMADEEREKAEAKAAREKREAEEETQRRAEYDSLIQQMEKEAPRIFGILEDADWSKAELENFITTKQHWWRRKKYVQYACLMFHSTSTRTFWMRSDGILLISYWHDVLESAQKHFQYYNYWIMNKHLKSMNEVLQELQGFVSLKDSN